MTDEEALEAFKKRLDILDERVSLLESAVFGTAEPSADDVYRRNRDEWLSNVRSGRKT